MRSAKYVVFSYDNRDGISTAVWEFRMSEAAPRHINMFVGIVHAMALVNAVRLHG